jgi:hypothetical protein
MSRRSKKMKKRMEAATGGPRQEADKVRRHLQQRGRSTHNRAALRFSGVSGP